MNKIKTEFFLTKIFDRSDQDIHFFSQFQFCQNFFCGGFYYIIQYPGGARGVIAIVVGNGHGDTNSNPGRDWLHFT